MKKAIKSLLIILLVVSMLFVLTGCGKEEKENNVTENNIITNEQSEVEQKVEFSMGEWKDNTYENEFLGIKFNLPEGWTYSSDEQIAQMMNVGIELLNDEQKNAAEMAKLTSVYYVVANDPNTGNNISIMSEKQLMDVTEEYYINQLKAQLEAVESINYEIGVTSKEKVADKEYNTLTATTTMSGIEIIQKYYVCKMDEYFMCIIVTSTTGENTIDTMMQSFE